ncbi:YcaO-like family protein [Staphylococcus pseudintermedius]|nr:hypothetical protein [Staphylococcus pseudintermedius]EGQ2810849.1 hypothetical protein [Staphylococcus pseudintermedius]EGQ4407749.1 hypothetical protein [Staphylococcus pseudintermedius]EIE3871910.1 YcaO-like family protein [Staphylococcus pseudintermedius]EIQ3870470.1 YcaO-like family protein [Staphylococcus pseudintermedius]
MIGKNTTVVPPAGIQQTYISVTKVGSMSNLYDIPYRANTPDMYGAGTGKNCEEAEKYANFEALERIANSINCRNEIVETYNNLKRNKVDLDKFPMISKKEYSMNTKLDKNQLIDWVECVDIINKELKMIPSSYVYLYNSELFQGDKITNPISTGAALHENYNKAIINGIYEVIERDGIALTWLIKKTNGNVNHLFTEDERMLFSSEFLGEVNYYDVSTVKGIITICAHAKAYYSDKVSNTLMFATDVNFDSIKKKLKKELISVMFSFNNKKKFNKDIDYNNFVSVDENGLYMAHDFNDKYFRFFDEQEKGNIEMEPLDNAITPDKELTNLLNILRTNDMDVYCVDITCREVKKNNYKAIKIVIPQLQPISFVHKSRYLESERLKKIAINYYGKDYFENLNHMPIAFS